jgi:hypothetical protein
MQKNDLDSWILSLKSKADSIHPSPDLKRRVMEQVEMKNQKGDTLAILRIDSFQDNDLMDAIIRELKPGMGKAIYIAGQGEGTFSQQTNYDAVKWEQGMNALLELATPWKLSFPVDAELQEIRVYYGFDNLSQDEIDGMVAESEQTRKPIIVRDLRPNGVLAGMQFFYMKAEGTFELRIFGTTKSRVHVPDMEKQIIEHLSVRGNQGVYVADNQHQHLIWAEEEQGSSKPLQYEILAEQGNRDWIISIAESLA